MEKRTLVIGDVHGSFKGMSQALERAKFNPDKDLLISLGDIADGWSQTSECVDYLLECRRFISVIGNHDKWCKDWFQHGQTPLIWTQQGGSATIESYVRSGKMSNEMHQKFWRSQKLFYVDEENRAFVHGGYTSIKGLGHEQYEATYYWDRNLWSTALSAMHKNNEIKDDRLPILLRPHSEIYIGHTATVNWDYNSKIEAPIGYNPGDPIMTPANACNVWNMDTGGGFGGKVSVMDIDTKQYWQSDFVDELYPDFKGR